MLQFRIVRLKSPLTALMLAASIAAILLAPVTTRAQTYALSDLPPEARPADLSVYLDASAAGTLFHVCQSTDVIGRFAWYLRMSEATLFDAEKNLIGKSHSKYSGIPRVRVEPAWDDVQGGTVVAKTAGRGMLPANPDMEWQRYDVQSHRGEGLMTAAKTIIRIAAWRTIPYAEPCDRSRAGAEVPSPFTATDLFLR